MLLQQSRHGVCEAGLNILRGLSPLGCANGLNREEEATQHQNRPGDPGLISQRKEPPLTERGD